jgi:hypothetical protein
MYRVLDELWKLYNHLGTHYKLVNRNRYFVRLMKCLRELLKNTRITTQERYLAGADH